MPRHLVTAELLSFTPETASIGLTYSTEDPAGANAGSFSFAVAVDSSVLQLEDTDPDLSGIQLPDGTVDPFEFGLVGFSASEDTDDLDNNANTDVIITFAYDRSVNGEWPFGADEIPSGQTSVDLGTLQLPLTDSTGTSTVNVVLTEAAEDFEGNSGDVLDQLQLTSTFNLDVDENGVANGSVDGLNILNVLFNLGPETMDVSQTDLGQQQVFNNVQAGIEALDVDDSGTTNGSVDGFNVLRVLANLGPEQMDSSQAADGIGQQNIFDNIQTLDIPGDDILVEPIQPEDGIPNHVVEANLTSTVEAGSEVEINLSYRTEDPESASARFFNFSVAVDSSVLQLEDTNPDLSGIQLPEGTFFDSFEFGSLLLNGIPSAFEDTNNLDNDPNTDVLISFAYAIPFSFDGEWPFGADEIPEGETSVDLGKLRLPLADSFDPATESTTANIVLRDPDSSFQANPEENLDELVINAEQGINQPPVNQPPVANDDTARTNKNTSLIGEVQPPDGQPLQEVELSLPADEELLAGDTVGVSLNYSTIPDLENASGLSLSIAYDSSVLTIEDLDETAPGIQIQDAFQFGLQGFSDQADDENIDNDEATDRVLNIVYLDPAIFERQEGQWPFSDPNNEIPEGQTFVELGEIQFLLSDTFDLEQDTTSINAVLTENALPGNDFFGAILSELELPAGKPTISGENLLANDTDPDEEDTPTVSAVNGDEANVGTEITLESGALLILNDDGSYNYDPNGAFDDINDGETDTDTFTYTVSDSNGETDTAEVTITIEGIISDSFPVITSDQTFTIDEGSTINTIIGTVEAVTPDDSELMFSLDDDNLPTDVDEDGTLPFAISEEGELTVTDSDDINLESQSSFMFGVTVTDEEGLTDTEMITVNLETEPQDPSVLSVVDDLVFGTSNNDTLNAADQNDPYTGNNQITFTGAGEDLVDGSIAGDGSNRNYGGSNADELFAGNNDRLFGEGGNDTLDASQGTGNNRLYGGDDNDDLIAGNNDLLTGGNGDDRLFVRQGGNNLLIGNSGADQFWIATDEIPNSPNIITDFTSGEDAIGFGGFPDLSFSELSLSQEGSNTLIGLEANNPIAELQGVQANTLTENDFVFAAQSPV